MPTPRLNLKKHIPRIVGSISDAKTLAECNSSVLEKECDILEIRLDLFPEAVADAGPALWKQLGNFPLLFTARKFAEGSPNSLDANARQELLQIALAHASFVDIELSSFHEMREVVQTIQSLHIPLIASYHNFEKLPPNQELLKLLSQAENAGAAVFKVAANLTQLDDLPALAKFQQHDSNMHIATMGMGPLAPVSRMLCAQSGSVLNYGYIGNQVTAPGQWSAAQMKNVISQLQPLNATFPQNHA